jgi:hypothetical protein
VINPEGPWGKGKTETFTGKVYGEEGFETINVSLGPHGNGGDYTQNILPGVKLGAGADGLGDGFSISIGVGKSTYGIGASKDGFTYTSSVTDDRGTMNGYRSTYAPKPLTGAYVAIGSLGAYLLTHPWEFVKRAVQTSE